MSCADPWHKITPMYCYDVFRLQTGERAGNVDYLGQVYAANMEAAIKSGERMFDCDPATETIAVKEAEDY
jgi:hypothetical protein